MRWVAVFLFFSGCIRSFARLEIEASVGATTGAVSGRIVDEMSRPVAGAFVSARGVRGRIDGQSAPDGTYSLTLEPDAYVLEVSAPSFVPVSLPPLDVAAGQALALGDIVLGLVSDETDPTIAELEIGSMNGLVPSADVMVHLEGFDNRSLGGALAFALANDTQDCGSAVYERIFEMCTAALCRADVVWTLAAGADGPRTVSLCLRDAAGRITRAAATASVVLDTTPPTQVTGVTLAARQGAFVASYTAASDAHLSHYELAYAQGGAPSFDAGELTSSDAAALEIRVRDVQNRLPYNVAVRACDLVGHCGAPSAPLAVTTGVRSQKLALPVSDSLSTGPTLAAFDDELWIAGTKMTSPTQEAIALYRCNVGVSRCDETSDWSAAAPMLTNANPMKPRTPVSPAFAVTPRQRFVAWTEVDGSNNHIMRARVCTAPDDCLVTSSWTALPATYPFLSPQTAPTLATNRELVVLSMQETSGRIWLLQCGTAECTDSTHYTKFSLPDYAQEPPQTVPDYGQAQPRAATEVTPGAWFHAYAAASIAGGHGAIAVATSVLANPTAIPTTTRFDSPSGYAVSPALAHDADTLYVAYWHFDNRDAELLLHACPLDSLCDALSDFTPPVVIATESDVDSDALSARLTPGVAALEVLWQRADVPETNLVIVKGSTLTRTLYSTYSESFVAPQLLYRDTNWWGVSSFADGNLWLRTPLMHAPRSLEATATTELADVRWAIDPDADGYLLRADTEHSIAGNAALQLPLSSETEVDVRAIQNGERSEPSRSVRLAPFAALNLLDGEESLSITSGGSQLVLVTKLDHTYTLRQCASACGVATNWRSFAFATDSQMGNGLGADRVVRLISTPHTFYAAGWHESAGAVAVRACARTDDCGDESHWTAVTDVAGTATTGAGFKGVYGVSFDGARLLIAGPSNDSGGDHLAYTYCTESGPKACASAAGYSTQASTIVGGNSRVSVTGSNSGFAVTLGAQNGFNANVTLVREMASTFPATKDFFAGLGRALSTGAPDYAAGPTSHFFFTTDDALYHFACSAGERCLAPYASATTAQALWGATRIDDAVPGSRVHAAANDGVIYVVYHHSVDRMRIAACRDRCNERSSWMVGPLDHGFVPSSGAKLGNGLSASDGKLHFAELYGASRTLRVLTGGVFVPRESRE